MNARKVAEQTSMMLTQALIPKGTPGGVLLLLRCKDLRCCWPVVQDEIKIPIADQIDLTTMTVEDNYDGPRLSGEISQCTYKICTASCHLMLPPSHCLEGCLHCLAVHIPAEMRSQQQEWLGKF